MNRKIGVIGTGLMGLTHIRLLRSAVSGAEIVAIADPSEDTLARAGAEAGVHNLYRDGMQLIADERVEAVLIASPAETHVASILACIEANKQVLCEKPLTDNVEASRRVLDAELAVGRRLVQVGFMRRFDPGYADIKNKLDQGVVGQPLLVHCAHRNRMVPGSFGSKMIVTDTVVHEMDIVRWLLGQEITRTTVLTPRASSLAADGVQDPQLVIFETEQGTIADVEAFVNAQFAYDIRCEVVGELGTLSLETPSHVMVRTEHRSVAELPSDFQQRFRAAYINELHAWLASIDHGHAVGPSAWDGYAATVVSEATVEALMSGRPVEIPLGTRPDLYTGAVTLAGQG